MGVVSAKSRRQLMQVLSWRCLSGTTTMPTCSGWIPRTLLTPLIQVLPEALAALTLVSQQMSRRSKLIPVSSSPTSGSDLLVPLLRELSLSDFIHIQRAGEIHFRCTLFLYPFALQRGIFFFRKNKNTRCFFTCLPSRGVFFLS